MEKRKAHFNFVDVLVILLLLAVVGAGVYLLLLNSGKISTEQADTAVRYVVRISGVDADTAKLIRVGQTVKNSSTGKKIGVVQSVRTESAKVFGDTAVEGEDGTLTVSVGEYADLYDVYVTLECSAVTDSRGIRTVDTIRLLVGSTVYFKVPSFASVSYITEILSK